MGHGNEKYKIHTSNYEIDPGEVDLGKQQPVRPIFRVCNILGQILNNIIKSGKQTESGSK